MKLLTFTVGAGLLLIPAVTRAESPSPYSLSALGEIYNECLVHRVNERAALLESQAKEKILEAQLTAVIKERDALKAEAKPTAPESPTTLTR